MRNQPAGGKVAPSKPSTNGNGFPPPLVTIEVLQSFAVFPSATPLGLEVQTVTVLLPNANDMAFKFISMDASEARLPVQLKVWTVTALTCTVIVAEVRLLLPKFLKVTVNGVVASHVAKLFIGVTIDCISASLATKTGGIHPLDVINPIRLGSESAACILTACNVVNMVIHASSV